MSATALAAGVFFAVLPIHSEVVNDVVGRTDLLATLGVLLALSAHHRLFDARSVVRKVTWAIVASLSAFCALGSKEVGLSVLGLIPLFDVWCHLESGSAQRDRQEGHRSWLNLRTIFRIGYVVVPATAYLALRYHALGGRLYQQPAASKTVNVLVDTPLWQHVIGVIQAWGMYWRKTFGPMCFARTTR